MSEGEGDDPLSGRARDGGDNDEDKAGESAATPKRNKKRVSISIARDEESSSSESFTSDSSSSESESEEDDKKDRRRSVRRSMDVDALRSSARRGKSLDIRRLQRQSMDNTGGDNDDDIFRRTASMDERRRYSLEQRSNAWRRSFDTSREYPGYDEPENTSLFGIMPFMNLTHKKDPDFALYQPPTKVQVDYDESMLTVGNVLWTVMFGWMLALVYFIGGGIMYITIVGQPYGALCFNLASYYFWPFGKYVMRRTGRSTKPNSFSTMDTFETPEDRPVRTHFSEDGDDTERRPLGMHPSSDDSSYPTATTKTPLGLFVLWVPIACFLSFFHGIAMFSCWMIVFYIPMAKINMRAIQALFKNPLELRVSTVPSGNIVFCTYQAASWRYYQYSAMGLNVVLVNLFFFVILTLIMGYAVPHDMRPPETVVFVSSLLSIVPIAYYIGMAVASIANQTNFAIGAMLNAIFGVSIEIILYGSAILNGGFSELIQAGVIGSLLGDLLLMPGLSMIAGGIKYKEQRFSPAVAGVSSVLLLISVIGVFAPTVFFVIAGGYNYSCNSCSFGGNVTHPTDAFMCTGCAYHDVDLDHDPMYVDRARLLMYSCAALMPCGYLVGLLFTLKTHSHLFKNMEDAEHDGPSWSKKTSTVILLCSITLFALVSEKAVEALEPTLEALGINQLFAGITVMALVPSSAEYVNAIGFALHNNVALSLEIGATSAVQISLIMTPVLIFFSAIVHDGSAENSFTLVFHPFSFFAIIMAVLVVNYISIEGVANYFKGATMVFCYLLFITTFYFFSLDRDGEIKAHH